jgi:hypothetical protein
MRAACGAATVQSAPGAGSTVADGMDVGDEHAPPRRRDRHGNGRFRLEALRLGSVARSAQDRHETDEGASSSHFGPVAIARCRSARAVS